MALIHQNQGLEGYLRRDTPIFIQQRTVNAALFFKFILEYFLQLQQQTTV